MSYAVYEMFYSLQGEGHRSGRPAVFVRMSGCNLWSGREQDRAKAICTFCDTQFVGTKGKGGARFATANDLISRAHQYWQTRSNKVPPIGQVATKPNTPPKQTPHKTAKGSAPYLIFTGGEPLLQVDTQLVEMAHDFGFEVAVETNGTIKPPPNIDWVTVSAKARADWIVKSGNELKLIYPQAGLDPMQYYAESDFDHYYLQPMGAPFEHPENNNTASEDSIKTVDLPLPDNQPPKNQTTAEKNTEMALEYCLSHPEFSLSIQLHKALGIR